MFAGNNDIFRTLTYSKPEAYSEPWYVQNSDIFRTLSYSEPKVYSVPCQTYAIEVIAKIVNGYNCFRNISFSHSLLNEINKTFNTGLIFAPKVFMQHKKSMVVEGTVKFDIPPGSFTVI